MDADSRETERVVSATSYETLDQYEDLIGGPVYDQEEWRQSMDTRSDRQTRPAISPVKLSTNGKTCSPALHDSSNGFTSSTPQSVKWLVFRVATAKPWARAIDAICPSSDAKGFPALRR